MQIENEKSYISALKIQKEKSELGIIDDLRAKDIDNKFFDLVERKFPWGKRNIFLLKEGQEENYKALQQSRSLSGGSSEINIEGTTIDVGLPNCRQNHASTANTCCDSYGNGPV